MEVLPKKNGENDVRTRVDNVQDNCGAPNVAQTTTTTMM